MAKTRPILTPPVQVSHLYYRLTRVLVWSGITRYFRIRGLDGFAGSKLIVYNRYGTVVYSKETASDAEFELVWNGNFANGNPAPAGVYQWVLLRADGLKDSGELSLMR